jgi:hypothetical protein
VDDDPDVLLTLKLDLFYRQSELYTREGVELSRPRPW